MKSSQDDGPAARASLRTAGGREVRAQFTRSLSGVAFALKQTSMDCSHKSTSAAGLKAGSEMLKPDVMAVQG